MAPDKTLATEMIEASRALEALAEELEALVRERREKAAEIVAQAGDALAAGAVLDPATQRRVELLRRLAVEGC